MRAYVQFKTSRGWLIFPLRLSFVCSIDNIDSIGDSLVRLEVPLTHPVWRPWIAKVQAELPNMSGAQAASIAWCAHVTQREFFFGFRGWFHFWLTGPYSQACRPCAGGCRRCGAAARGPFPPRPFGRFGYRCGRLQENFHFEPVANGVGSRAEPVCLGPEHNSYQKWILTLLSPQPFGHTICAALVATPENARVLNACIHVCRVPCPVFFSRFVGWIRHRRNIKQITGDTAWRVAATLALRQV